MKVIPDSEYLKADEISRYLSAKLHTLEFFIEVLYAQTYASVPKLAREQVLDEVGLKASSSNAREVMTPEDADEALAIAMLRKQMTDDLVARIKQRAEGIAAGSGGGTRVG